MGELRNEAMSYLYMYDPQYVQDSMHCSCQSTGIGLMTWKLLAYIYAG